MITEAVPDRRYAILATRESPYGVEHDLGTKGSVGRLCACSGAWLMPSLHGTKTIALGTRSTMLMVS
jgi:hypothetical protein